MMRLYRIFKMSEQIGDSPIMETVTKLFLPYFYSAGKTHSFETNLRLIELYYRLPAELLHQLRVNRCKQQKGGVKQDGQPRNESVLDLIMENLMPGFKGVSHEGTAFSFIRTAKILPLLLQCKNYMLFHSRNTRDTEYKLAEMQAAVNGSTANMTVDPSQSRKSTTAPRMSGVKIAVTEILIIAEVQTEIMNWPVDTDHFWRAVDCSTYVVEKKKTRRERVVDDGTPANVIATAVGLVGNGQYKCGGH